MKIFNLLMYSLQHQWNAWKYKTKIVSYQTN